MNRKRNNRQKAERLGHWAEFKAAAYLILSGHRIIAMRYKTARGEIDIIAKKSDLIIMVEVKARKTHRECVDAVSHTNQSRVHDAADIWLSRQKRGEALSIRFDIIAVTPWHLPKHFTNMF